MEKKLINTIQDLLQEEVMHESLVRALTDDFSVVDAVNYENRKGGNDGK